MWVWVQVRARTKSSMAISMGELGALDTENALKQQSNDTQGAVTHSGLWSKKTR